MKTDNRQLQFLKRSVELSLIGSIHVFYLRFLTASVKMSNTNIFEAVERGAHQLEYKGEATEKNAHMEALILFKRHRCAEKCLANI